MRRGAGRISEGIDRACRLWLRLLDASGYTADRVCIDPSVVRGLEYYTGPVYEAELTFTVTGDNGRPVRFGSVGGGGRYDGLVGRFRSEPVPATGFSIGVSRLLAALQAVKSPLVTGAEGPVRSSCSSWTASSIADYQRMVARLRHRRGGPPIRAELYLGGAGMKAQMKYADRRKSPCVVIQGSDERAPRRGADQGSGARRRARRPAATAPITWTSRRKRRCRCPKAISCRRCARSWRAGRRNEHHSTAERTCVLAGTQRLVYARQAGTGAFRFRC